MKKRFIVLASLLLALRGNSTAPVAPFNISALGVGPITKNTALSKEGFLKLFPGHSVNLEDSYSEGEVTGTVVHVRHAKQSVLNVYYSSEKALFSVEVLDEKYSTGMGLHAHSELSKLLSLPGKLECTSQLEEHSGEIACSKASEPNILYMFTMSNEERSKFSDGVAVSVTKPDGRKLIAIVWKP